MSTLPPTFMLDAFGAEMRSSHPCITCRRADFKRRANPVVRTIEHSSIRQPSRVMRPDRLSFRQRCPRADDHVCVSQPARRRFQPVFLNWAWHRLCAMVLLVERSKRRRLCKRARRERRKCARRSSSRWCCCSFFRGSFSSIGIIINISYR